MDTSITHMQGFRRMSVIDGEGGGHLELASGSLCSSDVLPSSFGG